ncbi:MAG: hypothetical protein IT201_11695 [Thermoleophilia bacterium]|nr:hypothetical protein [Thermoleophilia bacterium]
MRWLFDTRTGRLAAWAALLVALPVIGVLVAAYGDSSAAGEAKPAPPDYCRSQGGTVQVRYPAYGTNGPSPLRLAGSARFCRFEASDGSRIFVSLATLHATEPTLAAIAYLTQPPVGDIPGGPNPASIHCASLGGTESFGRPSAAGGGWVSDIDEIDPVLQVCVFPDRSMIDSWGITYHSWGTIRGRDLTNVLRYRAASPPELFG